MTKYTINKAALAVTTFSLAALPMLAKAQVDTEELFGNQDIAGELGQSDADIRVTVSRVIRSFMGLLGLVAVVIILLGGFKWMTAAGADEKVQEAKKLIISGVIGLVIILSAYGIAEFVISAIVTGQGGGGAPTP
jgi:hypothetical protein